MKISTQSSGVAMIAEERRRQVGDLGFGSVRDDGYTDNSLALAAVYYAMPPLPRRGNIADWFWPRSWSRRWAQKRTDSRVNQLIKAGALIAAEIDRQLRMPTAPTGSDNR